MAGYNIVILQLTHSLEHFVKFQITVAINTGIGRTSMFIGIYKTIHNIFFESLREIKNIIFNPHSVAYTSGVLHIIQRTAGFLPFNSYIFIVKQFHSCSNTLVTGFFGQQSCYGAIHSTAHGNNCFSHSFIPSYLNKSVLLLVHNQTTRHSLSD